MENPQPTNGGWIDRREAAPPPRTDEKSWMPTWVTYALGIIGLIYLINPTAGLLELLPDNLPLVGNLDDGVAAILIWQSVSEFLKNRRARRGDPPRE